MIEFKGEVRRWGNSLGIIIPKEIAKEEHLKPGQKVTALLIKENDVLKKTFGTAPAT